MSAQFREAIISAGLQPPAHIPPGKLVRFPGAGKNGRNRAGWCKLFSDGIGGMFGDWTTGLYQVWQAEHDRPQAPQERAEFKRKVDEARRQAEEQRREEQSAAAAKAADFLKSTSEANPDHPYLQRKTIGTHGARQKDKQLIIPMADAAGELLAVQAIDPAGGKMFWPSGCTTKGAMFKIGGDPAPGEPVLIAEGFATGAAIHEATGYQVIVAFNAGNLERVVRAVRDQHQDHPVILCADDDAETEGNPGITKATAAAQAIGGKLAVPGMGKRADFWDLRAEQGGEAVRAAIDAAVEFSAGGADQGEQEPEVMTPEECRDAGNLTTIIPVEISDPGGLISLGVSALTQPGMSQIIQYALPAVLATIATAINGRLTFRGVYPSTFNARVGPTSTGKSEGDKALSSAIRQAGLVGFYGPTEFASGPALLRALADRPRCLIVIDEGTSLFRRYGKADMVSDSKRDALLEVTTKAGGVIDKAYADEKRAILIENPCINITANATPTVFEAIQNDDFYTGLMQRVDFWVYDGPALKRERATDAGNPAMDAFVSGIADIFTAHVGEGNLADLTGAARRLEITRDADDRLFEWSHEITDKMNSMEDPGLRGIVSRAYDASIKYAIIHSVSTRPIEDITEPLTITDIEYGIATAWMLAEWKIMRLRDRITCGDFDRDCELFKEAIRRAVGIGRRPTLRTIVNRSKPLRNFTHQYFKQIVETLVARGEVLTDTNAKVPVYYLTRL